MNARTRSEDEQLAFFEAVRERVDEAIRRTGAVEFDYRIAGTTIRLCFAGDGLVPYYTPALEHLRIASGQRGDTVDTTIFLWDSRSTSTRMLAPPCNPQEFTYRGDIWGFHSQRIRTAFHYHDGSLNLFDRQRRIGMHWVHNARQIPGWDTAAPIRTLLHWHMESHGLQLIHGAVIGTGNGALLLTGKGGIGKSTTALECLLAGFQYLGDDYVVVRDGPEPMAYSLYATAKIGVADLGRFETLRPLLRGATALPGEKGVLFLHPEFRARMPLQMPIEAIAVPRIVEDAETRMVPTTANRIQHAASFTTLCQLPGAGRQLFDVIGRLCGTLPGFALQLGRQRGTAPAAVASLLRTRAAPVRHRTTDMAAVDPPSRPLLSVVIPVWNGERFLRSAVENVLSQQYAPIEILIVNDGSTDGTEAEVSRLPCDVRYFAQDNSGPAAARNRGIRESSGDVIAFLDVDDLWPENILALLVSELMGDAAVDVVHGYGQVLSLDPASGAYVSAGTPVEAFPHYIGAGVYRRRVFDRIGLFDPTMMYGEDADWYARAKSGGAALRRLDLVTLLVRRHERNMTRDTSQLTRGRLRVFKRALDRKRAAT